MFRSALAASYRTPHHARLETLEARHMMAAAPVAMNDSAYYSALNTDLVVTSSSNPARLIANDLDIDGSSLTASFVASPTSGSLIAFASDGTFTYRPNTGFVGVDSFTYKVNDGSLDSNLATVSIAVGTHLLARQDLQPLHVSVASGPDVRTGDMVFAESLNNDQTLVSSGDSLVRPVIAVDTQLASGVGVPSSITAQLTFNGTAGTTYSYDTSGLTSGQSLHFALQANGSSLATGFYDYSLSIVTTISGVAKTQVFTGKQAIVNRGTSVFGSGWWLDGLDQVVDSSAGALLVRGNGSSLWFAKSGSTYQSAAGDDSFSTLVKNTGNTITVTSKSGIVSSFSTSGLLTSVVDTNGNTLSYAYADRNSDGIASELISITDLFSRVTNINYTSGYVSSIAHFSGRTTTLSISTGVLGSYALPDPDGAGSLTSPTISFGYSGSLISSRTDAASKVTSFGYDTTDGRLRTITHPDSSTWQLLPADTVGLPTGTTGNAIQTSSDVQAQITDERSGIWTLRTDRFGLITESITALGFTSTILRNADGLPVMITEPDPDGTGPLTSSVTKYGYDVTGDLTHAIASDGGVVTATYSSGLHQVLSTVDPVGRTQSFTYDSSGNMLTSTDGAGYVTNYAYNSRGLTTSVTPPDPDGSGSLTSPVTSFAYDSYGRLVTATNPDSSTRTFTYSSADQILTNVDELGKTDSVTYDSLGRPISSTNRVSATTSVTYDAMSRMLSQTDALGNVTDYEYNNRGWLTKVTYPDPDGTGSLARPIDTRTYDSVGNQLTQGEAASLFSAPLSYAYDADNRRTSKSEPTSSSAFENYSYDNSGRLTGMTRYSSTPSMVDRTVVSYDAVGRVVRQSVQSQPLMGAPTIYAEVLSSYNSSGEQISQTDGRGYARFWTYNSRGLVATETLPDADGSGSQAGLVVTHVYDNMGREIAVSDGYGRVTSTEYNNRSWVTKITKPDPDGTGSLAAPVIQYGYSVRGDRTSVTDALSHVTTSAFDDAQRLTSVTYPDPDGSGPLASPVVSRTYNAAGWVLTQSDPLGGVTTNTYDQLGRMLTQTAPDPDGSGSLTSPVTTYVYGSAGLIKITDPMGHDITYTRDTKGRVATMTDASGNVTTYAYDYYSNLTSETGPDPDGAGPLSAPVTSYTYDSQDRLTSKTDPLGGSTSYTYDVNSNLTSLQDPEGNTTQFAYDGANRLVLSTNSLSKSKSYAFDMAGNLARTSDRNGRVIQYQYDDLGRQTEEDWQQSSTSPTLTVGTTQDGGSLDEQQSIGWSTTAFGMSGTYTITHNGQTTAAIAWNASAATIQTALEGLSSIGSGNISVTVTSPNTYSRTLSLTFRNGKGGTNVAQTTITTTGLMPVFSTVTPFNTTSVTGGVYTETQTINLSNATGGTWRVAFGGEISGQLSPSISATDLKTVLDGFSGIDSASVTGSAGSFTVTFGGTQSSVNMSQIFGDAANASCGSTIRTISTTYDANDQILSQSDPSATINYTLDNLGRATTISNSINGLTPTVAFNQAFDTAGNRTELKATIGSTLDFKNTYQYDAMNRLVETIQQGQSGGNAVTSKRVTQSYNAFSQRSGISRYQSTGTSNPVASTSFSFDTANRLTNIVHAQGSTTLSSYAYTYDDLSRIASINHSIDGLSTYSYDVSSQLTGADHTSQTDETYDFDSNGNRDGSGYTTSTNNRTTAAPGFTYTYDYEGNRTSRTNTSTGAVQEYTWDYRNRLTKVVDRGSSGGAITQQVDYAYDANNRMAKRVLDADGVGSSAPFTQYWAYDEGINALLEFRASSASDISHRYFWSDRVDDLFADEQVSSPSTAGNTLWALSDHLGSIRDIADMNESTGVTAITNHRTMTATGAIVAETNAAVDLLFAFTGKQLDDATGLQHNLFRWYDSALEQWLSEDPKGFAAGVENLRRYVGNSPVAGLDPSGLQEPEATTEIVLPVLSPEVSYPQSMALNPSSIRMLQVDLFRQSGRAIDITQLGRGCIGLALARAGYTTGDVGSVSPWLLRHQGTAYRELSDALGAQAMLNHHHRSPTFNVVALQIETSARYGDGFIVLPDTDLTKYNFSTYVGDGWFEYINGSFAVTNGQIDVKLTQSAAKRTPRVILTRQLPESYGPPLFFLLPTRRPGGLPPKQPF